MPVVRHSRSHDDKLYHVRAEAVGKKYTTAQNSKGANPPYSRQTLKGDRPLPRRRSYILNDTRGGPNSRPTPSWRRASPDEDCSTQSDTYTDDVDEEFIQTESGETSSAEDFSDTESSFDEGSVDITPALGSQEQFDQEVMIYYNGVDDSSLASQFLNLDDETWPCTDQMMTAEPDSLVSPSSSLSSVSAGDTLGWELEPSSLHLVDMKKFETVADFDGGVKMSPWPWGDYKYRPPTPQTYFDPEVYIVEDQLTAIQNMLREELTEVMAQEAILDGEKAMKRRERAERRGEKERRKKRRAEREDNRPITLAFNNQMVRGRTIYNP